MVAYFHDLFERDVDALEEGEFLREMSWMGKVIIGGGGIVDEIEDSDADVKGIGLEAAMGNVSAGKGSVPSSIGGDTLYTASKSKMNDWARPPCGGGSIIVNSESEMFLKHAREWLKISIPKIPETTGVVGVPILPRFGGTGKLIQFATRSGRCYAGRHRMSEATQPQAQVKWVDLLKLQDLLLQAISRVISGLGYEYEESACGNAVDYSGKI
ncbi:hypothetical protein CPC08DRAFT_727865 [Agrocybe pediades]|nr:hypothetical protein CPC08DRAFT_727865 [Agrocybe pediades]